MRNLYQNISEESLTALIDRFYGAVRQDQELGPVFAGAIAHDKWPHHLAIIQSFWSSVMLKSGRYKGNPFGAHARIEEISPALFERWLTLFGQACRELFEPEPAGQLEQQARRIAESLQAGLFFRPSTKTG